VCPARLLVCKLRVSFASLQKLRLTISIVNDVFVKTQKTRSPTE
jgi:hypothetical protein